MNRPNWRCRLTLLTLIVACLSNLAPAQADESTSHREKFSNADVTYGWVTNSKGQKLRTFVTRPRNVPGRVPLIFFVGWLSCDSMEYPNGAGNDGFGALMLRLIEESGYATIRMDKPGVGESEGDCSKADFQSELEGWKAAFDSIFQV
jgi:hypothetical protein